MAAEGNAAPALANDTRAWLAQEKTRRRENRGATRYSGMAPGFKIGSDTTGEASTGLRLMKRKRAAWDDDIRMNMHGRKPL